MWALALHLQQRQQRQQRLTSVRAHQFLRFYESNLLKYLLAATSEVLGSPPTESTSSNPQANTNTHPSVDGQESREATDASSGTKDAALSTAATEAAGAAGKPSNSGSIVDSSSAPSRPPPSHHRKESIPTTAYPSGTFDSPRATAPPIGGTAGHADSTEQHAHEQHAHKHHKTVQEIKEQMHRDSLRVQAAGAFSGGYEAYEGRDHTQERGASHQPIADDAAATAAAHAAHSATHSAAHSAAHETSPGAPHLSVQEIEERMHRDSLRVQAAGAF